jgi:hypothetical protein
MGVANTEDECPDNNCFKADPSLKSFLFTLNHRPNLSLQRFGLRVESQDRAIYCCADRGPHFWDIGIANACNANTDSYGYLNGRNDSYRDDARKGTETFFGNWKLSHEIQFPFFRECKNETGLREEEMGLFH